MTYELIYEQKNNIDFYNRNMKEQMEVLSLSDQDLIIDLKLGNPRDIRNLYDANAAN